MQCLEQSEAGHWSHDSYLLQHVLSLKEGNFPKIDSLTYLSPRAIRYI